MGLSSVEGTLLVAAACLLIAPAALVGVGPAQAVAAPSPQAGRAEAADRHAGSYAFVGGKKERKARDAAIDHVVDQMSVLVRSIARSRLRDACAIPEALSVRRDGGHVTIEHDGRSFRAPIDGTPVQTKGRDGDEVTLRHRIVDGSLVTSFDRDEGGELDRFSHVEEDRWRLQVRIHSEKLPRAIVYTLSYARR